MKLKGFTLTGTKINKNLTGDIVTSEDKNLSNWTIIGTGVENNYNNNVNNFVIKARYCVSPQAKDMQGFFYNLTGISANLDCLNSIRGEWENHKDYILCISNSDKNQSISSSVLYFYLGAISKNNSIITIPVGANEFSSNTTNIQTINTAFSLTEGENGTFYFGNYDTFFADGIWIALKNKIIELYDFTMTDSKILGEITTWNTRQDKPLGMYMTENKYINFVYSNNIIINGSTFSATTPGHINYIRKDTSSGSGWDLTADFTENNVQNPYYFGTYEEYRATLSNFTGGVSKTFAVADDTSYYIELEIESESGFAPSTSGKINIASGNNSKEFDINSTASESFNKYSTIIESDGTSLSIQINFSDLTASTNTVFKIKNIGIYELN